MLPRGAGDRAPFARRNGGRAATAASHGGGGGRATRRTAAQERQHGDTEDTLPQAILPAALRSRLAV